MNLFFETKKHKKRTACLLAQFYSLIYFLLFHRPTLQETAWIDVCLACTPACLSVPAHTTAQQLLQQVAWHWFDIQGHANIIRPGRVQPADADRWPHQPNVRALKRLQKTAFRLLCMTGRTVPSGVWKATQQWEGSIRAGALMSVLGCLLFVAEENRPAASIIIQIPNGINNTFKVTGCKLPAADNTDRIPICTLVSKALVSAQIQGPNPKTNLTSFVYFFCWLVCVVFAFIVRKAQWVYTCTKCAIQINLVDITFSLYSNLTCSPANNWFWVSVKEKGKK